MKVAILLPTSSQRQPEKLVTALTIIFFFTLGKKIFHLSCNPLLRLFSPPLLIVPPASPIFSAQGWQTIPTTSNLVGVTSHWELINKHQKKMKTSLSRYHLNSSLILMPLLFIFNIILSLLDVCVSFSSAVKWCYYVCLTKKFTWQKKQ